MNEFNFKYYDTSRQSISYCEVDKCKAVIELRNQLDQLKEELAISRQENEEGKEINAELKAEREELRGVIRKDICSHYVLGECSQKHHNNCVGRNQCIKDLEQECEQLKGTFDGLFKVQYQLADNNKKLRQCLTEIKEIAEDQKDVLESMRIDVLEQILNKISECEVKNGNN